MPYHRAMRGQTFGNHFATETSLGHSLGADAVELKVKVEVG